MCMTWVYRSEHFICVHNPAVLLEVSWDLSIHMFANFETKAMKSPSSTSQFEATLAEGRDAISPLKSTSSSPSLSTELWHISRNFVGNLFRFESHMNSHTLLYNMPEEKNKFSSWKNNFFFIHVLQTWWNGWYVFHCKVLKKIKFELHNSLSLTQNPPTTFLLL